MIFAYSSWDFAARPKMPPAINKKPLISIQRKEGYWLIEQPCFYLVQD